MHVYDSSYNGESTTLTRLLEFQVKCDVARQECYAGRQRRIVNQQIARVVSHETLRDMIEPSPTILTLPYHWT
uniref:Uncharacterized protein n=1 Tax=Arion vulgaris TaxID=1028688 RepID=A0A0B6ZGK5_9EUPU